jgi:hypothetical protein
MEHVLMYINNRISVGTSTEDVTMEVINKFKPEMAFFDAKPEMIENFIELLCMQSYMFIYNRLESENKRR